MGYLTEFISEIVKNAKTTIIGYNGNRFTNKIQKISAFIYIRGGKSFYEFLAVNLKLPVLRSVQRFMEHDLPPLEEFFFDFLGLKRFIEENKFSTSVGLHMDAAKILENVRYDSSTQCLLGLTAPFDEITGLPLCISLDPAYKIKLDMFQSKSVFDLKHDSFKLSSYVCHAEISINFDEENVRTAIMELLIK